MSGILAECQQEPGRRNGDSVGETALSFSYSEMELHRRRSGVVTFTLGDGTDGLMHGVL